MSSRRKFITLDAPQPDAGDDRVWNQSAVALFFTFREKTS
jgi:hypothetical protein